MGKFNALFFLEKNTTFLTDFQTFRAQWFMVEDQISGIKDVYEPVNWAAIRESAKEVVKNHERLLVKFLRDYTPALSQLPSIDVAGAQHAIEVVLEYLDSVGLYVLKLYEISEKLYNKTRDPYSYTMSDYNRDIMQLKQLDEAFCQKGILLNNLMYGK